MYNEMQYHLYQIERGSAEGKNIEGTPFMFCKKLVILTRPIKNRSV